MSEHPAIALILEAEQTPTAVYNTRQVEELLAVASQMEPETLSRPWIVRLALRLADVLVQRGVADRETNTRAQQWLGVASEKASTAVEEAAVAMARARWAAMTARYDEAEEALQRASELDVDGEQVTQRNVVAAELAWQRERHDRVIALLDPLVGQEQAFQNIDQLWRALALLAQAYEARFEFERAAALYDALADLAEVHGLEADRADALVNRGRCRFGIGRFAEGTRDMKQGLTLARSVNEQGLAQGAAARLVAATMGAEGIDAAIAEVRSAAGAAARDDDFVGFVRLVGIATSLYRMAARHEDAYRMLVDVYGVITAKFGAEKAREIRRQIDLVRADLGEEAFQALSARLVEEKKARIEQQGG